MGVWLPEVEMALRDAGWEPGRRVSVTAWRDDFAAVGLDMHQAAEGFLAEFGGLRFDLAGQGVTSAKEPFTLDPLLCAGEEDRFIDWAQTVNKSIFPVGELDDRYFLGIDEDGAIYLVANWLAVFGIGPAGLDALIRGLMPKDVA